MYSYRVSLTLARPLMIFIVFFFKIRSDGGNITGYEIMESETVYEKCIIFTSGIAVFRDYSDISIRKL
jgi:hypothetical protein